MYQTFLPPPAVDAGAERVGKIRQLLRAIGVSAVLVPRADEHQGEYVAPSADRLRWLTGFSGSAGMAAISMNKAALFVDGRYTVQARQQVDTEVFEILQVPQNRLSDWLGEHLSRKAVVGFDPWLHTITGVERLQTELDKKGIGLKPLARNLVDRIWGRERPAPPKGAVVPQPIELAGRSAAEKIAEVQKMLAADAHDAVVLTQPDSIAWLLNIRGSDVVHNPVPLAFAIVPRKGKPELYIDAAKLGGNVRSHVAAVAKVLAPEALKTRIAALRQAGKRVRLDESTAAWWFKRALGGSDRVIARGQDPCLLPKARKAAAEIAGARAAHVRDGVAVARFLAWLDREAPSGAVDEIAAVRRLEELRRETGALKEISFDTIAGSGPNAAIVHYRVTEASNRLLGLGELFLVDSGSQYEDGTTDITRTIAIGEPSAEMRDRFTRVLKGHIAIATARFPKGTHGAHIDAMARRALWAAGLDFDHGTGHGVGSYLSVHEGPQRIAKTGTVPLEPGMIVSNEPGYYKEGAYGIRIENLLVVTPLQAVDGGEREMMGFETLTLAPIDSRLVVPDLLERTETAWLDGYHERVAEVIGPKLDAADRGWLEQATQPLVRTRGRR